MVEAEDIDKFTQQGDSRGAHRAVVRHMIDWLEDNQQANFEELVDFILQKTGEGGQTQ